MTGLNEIAEGAGKLLKAVPEVYDDGLKEATIETGKTINYNLLLDIQMTIC